MQGKGKPLDGRVDESGRGESRVEDGDLLEPGAGQGFHGDVAADDIEAGQAMVRAEAAIEVRPSLNQIDDLMGEIRTRAKSGERTLVTTITKRMAEELSSYLIKYDIK